MEIKKYVAPDIDYLKVVKDEILAFSFDDMKGEEGDKPMGDRT